LAVLAFSFVESTPTAVESTPASSVGSNAVNSNSISVGPWNQLALYDFTHGGIVETTGSTPDFTFFSSGPFVGNDGSQTSKDNYVRISSVPFHLTASPAQGGNPLDHVKFLALTTTSFAISPGKAVSCHTRVRANQVIPNSPFGTLTQALAGDPRLAAGALTTLSSSFVTGDFWVTNSTIYALYERLPFGRTQTNVYAAFSHLIPVATRTPDQWNSLTVTYANNINTNKSITWSVDGVPLFTVTNVGFRVPQYLVRDEGGVEQDAFPTSVQCALGTFDLLDAYPPCTNPSVLLGSACVRASSSINGKYKALVDLSNGTSPMYDPITGGPAQFFDPKSLPSSRLFGQGVVLDVNFLIVFETDLSFALSFFGFLETILQIVISILTSLLGN